MKVTLFGPRVDGSYILRIEGKPNGQSHKVKGHVELNVKSGDLHRVLAEQKLYDDIAALKLAHFVGYIGENQARKAAIAGDLLSKGYIKNTGKKAIPFLSKYYGEKQIAEVFSLQNAQRHGIDLICRVKPYPPKPKWITIETKTTMRNNFGKYATPKSAATSNYQKDPINNLEKHALFAKDSPNEYFIDSKSHNILKELLSDIDKNKQKKYKEKNDNEELIQAFKLTLGIDSNFNVAHNSKYNQIYIFEGLTK
ncbi:hypothetical protein [Providencia sneebia]|uniref:Uncharacterized protein n=1 Tax=Providencia sneebia DSM 19967 TaxID=1141660 RepID=K8W646_9GAMM|nr:hypothetical protein OO7_13634 [Providencia sneebia DSM 19967]